MHDLTRPACAPTPPQVGTSAIAVRVFRVHGESRGQALFLTLAGREYIAVPKTDGPGYELDEVPRG